jgi:hypothetical protein
MKARTFRFDGARLLRSMVALITLASFPAVLYLMEKGDTTLYIIFSVLCAAYLGTVTYTFLRFRLELDDKELRCRGRTRSRTIELARIERFTIRAGRDKGTRFMGPAPFRELVLYAGKRPVVISSLPLGEAAFDELVALISERLPDLEQTS